MKTIITISFLIFYSILFSQELPLKDGKLHFEKVVDIEGTKDNFYTNARVWFTENFNSADAVIQMDDKEAGIIIGKGYSEVYVSGGMFGAKQRVFYTIKIQLKENKYKVDIYDIYYNSYATTVGTTYLPATKSYPEDWYLPTITGGRKELKESYKTETISLMNKLISSIQNSVNKKVTIEDF